MKNKQKGFTLIELIVVIVILGILAATALPKFIDLSTEAGDAAAAGAAGALNAASALNYSKFVVSGTAPVAITSGTSKCSALVNAAILQGGALPDGVSWIADNTITCSNPAGAGGSDTTNCQLKHSKGTAAGTNATKVTVVCTG